ncbi:MAG: DNA polymerase III subunit epsilon [Betaproteobacteria bacterium]
MRQIVLDTETTGLNARLGDRVIEIGCLEIFNRRVTDRHWHQYINPERKSEPGALAVHGIADEFLEDKPKFKELARDFLDFVSGAELIIHNAGFDIEFLDAELQKAGLDTLDKYGVTVTDTLKLARSLHPGKKNSLDALCERYEIANSHRTLHGALLDAQLLAEVFLAMTRGQDSLLMDIEAPAGQLAGGEAQVTAAADERPGLIVLCASKEELAEHEKQLAVIDKESKGACVWHLLERRAG